VFFTISPAPSQLYAVTVQSLEAFVDALRHIDEGVDVIVISPHVLMLY